MLGRRAAPVRASADVVGEAHGGRELVRMVLQTGRALQHRVGMLDQPLLGARAALIVLDQVVRLRPDVRDRRDGYPPVDVVAGQPQPEIATEHVRVEGLKPKDLGASSRRRLAVIARASVAADHGPRGARREPP